MMLSGVPNLVQTFGYINASWTLRADINAEWTCRLINRLDETGYQQVTPQLLPLEADQMATRLWIDNFPAGYMTRSMHLMPKQGDRTPWINTQDYEQDCKMVRDAPVEDDWLIFSNPANEGKKRKAA